MQNFRLLTAQVKFHQICNNNNNNNNNNSNNNNDNNNNNNSLRPKTTGLMSSGV